MFDAPAVKIQTQFRGEDGVDKGRGKERDERDKILKLSMSRQNRPSRTIHLVLLLLINHEMKDKN